MTKATNPKNIKKSTCSKKDQWGDDFYQLPSWQGIAKSWQGNIKPTHTTLEDLFKDFKWKQESDYTNSEPVATIDRRQDIDYINSVDNQTERFALIVLAELVANGMADFLFIEYPELGDFWAKHRRILGAQRKEQAEKQRVEQVRKSALNKLTEEEKRVLGIK